MKWKYVIINLIIPCSYIIISHFIFKDSERGRIFPYIVALAMFAIHVGAIFVYAQLRKKEKKWTFLNFILLMMALGANIFIFEKFLFE